MNINSIHAYDSIRAKNGQTNERSKNVTHPLAVRNDIAFGVNGAEAEGLWNKIKNIDCLSLLGKAKQAIETAGFFVIFLVQDMIGMTLPRTWTGFNRDREITGKYHIQEGLEVFGREGLTGPAMMAVPAAAFAITAATMGKSTFVNSRLIKAYGKSFANTVKEIAGAKSKSEVQAKYIENALKQIVKETLGIEANKSVIDGIKNKLMKLSDFDDYASFIKSGIEYSPELSICPAPPKKIYVSKFEETFGYSLEKIKKLLKNETLESTTELTDKQVNKLLKLIKKDLKASSGEDLQRYIDNVLLERSGADLSKLDKVKLGGNYYSAGDATDALFRYGEDAIVNNKKLAEIDEAKAEDFMNSMLGKRCISNLFAMASVLGVMNYLPKIYAFGKTAPGEATKAMVNEANTPAQKDTKGNVAFTGLFSTIGKGTGKLGNFALAEGEFHGINFSNTVMTALSIIGLTIPRGKRAYDRAPEKTPEQRQNDGWFSKLFDKDVSEIKEIVIRDPISALSVVFAVPLLTRAMVNAYEKASGFLLINHMQDEGSGLKKILNYLNPYNSISVLSNRELDALYGKIDSHSKLVNVCEYLSNKGADLEKIFSKATDKAEIFNEKTFTLNSIRETAKQMTDSKAALNYKNGKILDLLKTADAPMQSKMVEALLPNMKKNKALGVAKTLNALPFFLNLVVISPFILGVVIPKYTYALTRKSAEKNKVAQEPQQINTPQTKSVEQKKELELKTA